VKGRPLGSGAKLAERRKRAVKEAVAGDFTQVAVAKKYNVTLRALQFWMAAYRKDKKKGLESKPTPGAPRRLSAGQIAALEEFLLKGAKAAGFPNDLWSCPRIRDLIEKKFGVSYHVDHIGRLLSRLGWSPQRPEKQAIERDDKRIRHWVKKEFPRIKKKPND
jgi:putative transposase